MPVEITKRNSWVIVARKVTVSACLGFAAAGAILGIQLKCTVSSAQNCILSMQTLVPGKSTLTEARADLRQSVLSQTEERCVGQVCSVSFVFESWMSRLSIVKYSAFRGYVLAKNGTVTNIHFLYDEDGSVALSLKETAELTPGNMLGFSVSVRDIEHGPVKMEVRLPTTAPADSRRLLMDLNLGCMGKIPSCSSAREVIPELQSLRFIDES